MDPTIEAGPESLAGDDAGQQWALTVVHHADAQYLGRTCQVGDAGVLLGREGEALGAGLFDDGRVSRRHAQVSQAGGALSLRDLGSRNGTYVNGARVDEQALDEGDVIGLGTLMLLCHRVPASYAPVADEHLLGVGPAHAALVRSVEAVASRDTPVLVRGETGTGRDRVAAELHRRSGRGGRLVAVHCGELSAGQPREELLGDGGLVASAAGGTLYLDSLGDASEDVQVSLIRLLETDGAGQRSFDVRVVASTPEPLADLVARGAIRDDVAARFGRFEIVLPPLRERLEDVPHLAAAFVRRFAGEATPFDYKLMLHLVRYRWPGNVRELESIVERAVIEAGDGDRIGLSPAVEELLGRAIDASSEPPYELSSREDPAGALRVAADGSWFEVAGGERVDIEKRRALPALLTALIEARASSTGLPVPALIERGWPGERMLEEAGANRVYVALTTLRKLGLRDYIARNRSGYCLDPEARVVVVQG